VVEDDKVEMIGILTFGRRVAWESNGSGGGLNGLDRIDRLMQHGEFIFSTSTLYRHVGQV
jgi:hypothetical protein